ncbi:MAG: SEC-C metal-binding domain-containing protein, partial [Burkholderiaceae bacterium]|nr:SEC-C metal-binding domain-containing protein [Burkholderiaceae bacterium]
PRTRIRTALAAGGLAVAALLGWAFAPRPVPVEVAEASVGLFETTVDEESQRYKQALPAGAVPRVGRNDPCPCGSGKKYKLCHGKLS